MAGATCRLRDVCIFAVVLIDVVAKAQVVAPNLQLFNVGDPDNGDTVYSDGDVFTITFDKNTNRGGFSSGTNESMASFGSLFNVSSPLGDFTWQWVNARGLDVIVTNATGGSPIIGTTTVTIVGDIRDISGISLAASGSFVLSGDFGVTPPTQAPTPAPTPVPAAPVLISFVASDPDNADAVVSSGDLLTIKFDKATDYGGFTVATPYSTNLSSIFSFNVATGNYTWQWSDASTVVISITSPAGWAPVVGSTYAYVGGNIRDSLSLSSPATGSILLNGTFGTAPTPAPTPVPNAPVLAAFVASDPDNADTVFSNGDVLTIKFDKATNYGGFTQATIYTQATLSSIFNFNVATGSCNWHWADSKTVIISIDDVTGWAPVIGSTVVYVGGNVRDSTGLSSSAWGSIVLNGTFGETAAPTPAPTPAPSAPVLTSFVASDPDNGDAVFGSGDTLTITFDKATNYGGFSVATTYTAASLGTILTFSASIGDYFWQWSDASTVSIIVSDPTGGSPVIGTTTVSIVAGAIRDSTGLSPNASGSYVLNGTFGVTPSPTPVPTASPTPAPTFAPSSAPSPAPTLAPTLAPSEAPTLPPTLFPSPAPTSQPTAIPTLNPTQAPTAPTGAPSAAPSAAPSPAPTLLPSTQPTPVPTVIPSASPTPAPTAIAGQPSLAPTPSPTPAVPDAVNAASSASIPDPAGGGTTQVGGALLFLAPSTLRLAWCMPFDGGAPITRYHLSLQAVRSFSEWGTSSAASSQLSASVSAGIDTLAINTVVSSTAPSVTSTGTVNGVSCSRLQWVYSSFNTAPLSHLPRATSYRFSVKAENIAGNSSTGRISDEYLFPSVPSAIWGAATNYSSPDSFNVSWRVAYDGGRPVTATAVQVEHVEYDWTTGVVLSITDTRTFTVTAATQSLNVSFVAANSSYRVRIQHSNIVGTSAWSNWTVYRHPQRPSPAVQMPHVVFEPPVYARVIFNVSTMYWADGGLPISAYSLQFRGVTVNSTSLRVVQSQYVNVSAFVGSDGHGGNVRVTLAGFGYSSVSVVSFNVTLPQYAFYEVRVRRWNAMGASDWSSWSTTPFYQPGLPGAPSALNMSFVDVGVKSFAYSLQNLPFTRVVLNWTGVSPTDDGGDPIHAFRVEAWAEAAVAGVSSDQFVYPPVPAAFRLHTNSTGRALQLVSSRSLDVPSLGAPNGFWTTAFDVDTTPKSTGGGRWFIRVVAVNRVGTSNGTTFELIDACLPSPCSGSTQSRGCLIEPLDDFTPYNCNCTRLYAGPRCEYSLGAACIPNFCQNGATCVPPFVIGGLASCACAPGWSGSVCTVDIDECALTYQPLGVCDKLSTCVNTRGSYNCTNCPASYHQVDMSRFPQYPLPHRHTCVTAEVSCSAYVTNETGTSVTCQLGLSRSPTATTRIDVYSNDTSELRVTGGSFTFATGTTNLNRTFTVTGVRDDLADGDVHACLGILAGAAAPEYSGLHFRCAAMLINEDVRFPQISSVAPTIVSLIGSNLTLQGARFDQDMRIAVGGRPVSLFYERSANRFVFRAPTAPNVSAGGANWVDTYQSFVLVNTDGGSASCPGACLASSELYYVDACPEAGWYGSGLSCRPCPSGGICPGGSRIRADVGYWIESEFADPASLVRCKEPAELRCPGGSPGQPAACGAGYTGLFCDECAEEYYADVGVCFSCKSGNEAQELLLTIIIVGSLFAVVGLMVIFSDDKRLNIFVDALVVFQQGLSVFRGLNPFLPTQVQQASFYASALMFDYNFIKPECSVGKISYTLLYFGYCVFCIFVLLFLCLCALLYQCRHAEAGENWIRRPSHPRVMRASMAAFHVLYLQFFIKTASVIHCQSENGAFRLAVERSTVCYEGEHAIAGVLGWFMMIFYFIGTPLVFLRVLQQSFKLVGTESDSSCWRLFRGNSSSAITYLVKSMSHKEEPTQELRLHKVDSDMMMDEMGDASKKGIQAGGRATSRRFSDVSKAPQTPGGGSAPVLIHDLPSFEADWDFLDRGLQRHRYYFRIIFSYFISASSALTELIWKDNPSVQLPIFMVLYAGVFCLIWYWLPMDSDRGNVRLLLQRLAILFAIPAVFLLSGLWVGGIISYSLVLVLSVAYLAYEKSWCCFENKRKGPVHPPGQSTMELGTMSPAGSVPSVRQPPATPVTVTRVHRSITSVYAPGTVIAKPVAGANHGLADPASKPTVDVRTDETLDLPSVLGVSPSSSPRRRRNALPPIDASASPGLDLRLQSSGVSPSASSRRRTLPPLGSPAASPGAVHVRVMPTGSPTSHTSSTSAGVFPFPMQSSADHSAPSNSGSVVVEKQDNDDVEEDSLGSTSSESELSE